MKPVTQPRTSQPSPGFSGNAVGRLFFLEASGDWIHSVNTDGADRKVILSGCRAPDGIVLDLEADHIYWTDMGVATRNDGSIERGDLDGQKRITIVREGYTRPAALPVYHSPLEPLRS